MRFDENSGDVPLPHLEHRSAGHPFHDEEGAAERRRVGGDGRPAQPQRRGVRGVIPVSECARQIARAMERRDRELVMTAAGKLGLWLRLVAPGLVDRVVVSAVARFDREEQATSS